MRALVLALAVLCWLSAPASAGAWLRDKGAGFSSYSIVGARDNAWGTMTFLEYGATAKTTIGAETGFFLDRNKRQTGYATAFFKRALNAPDAELLFAYELGLGAAWTPDTLLWHLKTGLSFGKSIQIGEKYGWLGVESAVLWDLSGSGLHVAKLDTTLGLNFTDGVAGMVQLYTTDIAGDFYATFAPSAIVKIGSGKFKIQIGTETDLKNPRNSALKIGLWREF